RHGHRDGERNGGGRRLCAVSRAAGERAARSAGQRVGHARAGLSLFRYPWALERDGRAPFERATREPCRGGQSTRGHAGRACRRARLRAEGGVIADEAEARAFCAERIDAAALARLERFAALLVAENERQNLVSAASLESVWQRHFADSLQLIDHVPREPGPWLDLGSGAGFPGLVLAIAQPEIEMVLVESRKRRVEWLVRAAAELGLVKCRVVGARLESVDSFEAGVITARAFAPLGKLLSLSARF